MMILSRKRVGLRCCIWATWTVVLMGLVGQMELYAQSDRHERTLRLLQQRREDLHADFAREMNALADFCEKNSFLTDAERIRNRAQPISAGVYDLDNLPDRLLPEIPPNLPDIQQQWQVKLRKLEQDYAADLYRLCRDAINQGHYSLAFEVVREVAFHDPDHEFARSMLGQLQHDGVWMTPFERTMQVRKYLNHPDFGWIPESYEEKYEAGERMFNGRWMSVQREASQRSDFDNAWEVETEHFHVRTNVSLEMGVQISRRMEDFHNFFLREFTPFFNTPQQMQQLFTTGIRRSAPRRQFRVYYLSSKKEFVEMLQARQPNISMANGLYMPNDRIAYFYFDDRPDAMETLYHEVTHQLLGESLSKTVPVGENSDFWVIEGIACYMESYETRTEKYPIGHPQHIRIYWARKKVLDEGYYIPMRKFTALSQNQFQRPSTGEILHAYYSQATGMVHFFLHYENGLYKDAFIQYLSDVYNPNSRVRANHPTLEQLTGVRFETLDQQYRDYLETLPTGPPLGGN